MNFLLYAHVFTVVVGYVTMFVIGGLGICRVVYQSCQALSSQRRQSLGRAVYWFNRIALVMVIAGYLLGTLVCKQMFGRYWLWDAREIGALGVISWLVALVAMQRFGRQDGRGTMLVSIGGNIIVSLAWFGANLLVRHASGNYWPLALFIGIQIPFLILGCVPDRTDMDASPRF
jgi:hypothetical protein